MTCRRAWPRSAGNSRGAFTLVAAHADVPSVLVAARRNSPLVSASGDGEMFVASDVSAFIAHIRDAIELGQDQLVVLTLDRADITSFAGSDYKRFRVDWDMAAADKGGFSLHGERDLRATGRRGTNPARAFDGSGIVLDEQRLGVQELRTVDKVYVVACGTAYHSGLVAKYAIEHWTRIPVKVELGGEFRYRDPVLGRETLVAAGSHFGETADHLEAVRHACRQGARAPAVCNTNGSQIPRDSDAVLYTRAGPEVGVAATKTFLAQVTANYLVGLALAQAGGTKSRAEIARQYAALSRMQEAVAATLTVMDPVHDLARELAHSPAVLFLGRRVGYPVALEGALKLKELAYMHADGFAAVELKHGPIALIENGLPVVVTMPSPKSRPILHCKMLSDVREIGPRRLHHHPRRGIRRHGGPFRGLPDRTPQGARIVPAVGRDHTDAIIAAEIARSRGYDIDKPRNLAKSVTVE